MKLNCDYQMCASDWSSSNESMWVCLFVLVCDGTLLTSSNCVCARAWACAHMCLHVHMCGHVQLQAVYSTDIISMSTQRWVVLISFPSMPFKQHGNHSGEWIWNKFTMHWSGDSRFCVWTETRTHTYLANTVQYFDSNSASLMVDSHGYGIILCL